MKRFMMVCASVVMLSCLASAQEKKDLSARIQSSLEQVRSSMSDGKGVRNENLEECKISGYDCKEVVDLFYEIFMEEDEAGEPRFSTEQQELVIVEPYAAQLAEMKIVIVEEPESSAVKTALSKCCSAMVRSQFSEGMPER